MERERAGYKPVNETLYNSRKNYVERHGGIVMRGGDEVTRHLDRQGAGGSCNNDVILLRDDATTSEVLEETYHFEQNRSGEYEKYPDDEVNLRIEIDAQKWLLSVSKRYNIPRDEIEQTKKNLAVYERKLDEVLRSRDDSKRM